MIAEAVMPRCIAESATLVKGQIASLSIDAQKVSIHRCGVIDSEQLLGELEAQGVSNADIARVLKIDPAGVTRMKKKGGRRLLLDEAVKLVEAFDLEQPPSPQPLPAPVSRLVVRYLAAELGVQLDEQDRQLQELAEDVRAFSAFVTDPKVQPSVEAAETFFRAIRHRRPAPAKEERRGNDPHLAN